jgi:hypothetical protein
MRRNSDPVNQFCYLSYQLHDGFILFGTYHSCFSKWLPVLAMNTIACFVTESLALYFFLGILEYQEAESLILRKNSSVVREVTS